MTGEPGNATVFVIPQPTVNGPLHIGHLSGPYLAGDIAARAAKARGERVLTLAGVDVNPNYVLTKAESLGTDVDEFVERNTAQITAVFDQARIDYDMFVDPRDPGHQRAITGLLTELVTAGIVPMEEFTLLQCSDCRRTLHHSYVVGKCPVCGTGSNGTSCEVCGGFTSAQVLIDPSCTRCGGSPQPLEAIVPVLRLEDYRDRLVAEWLRGEWPASTRAVLRQYDSAPLPAIPLAYPTNWGIEGDGPLAGLRVDFPTELGLVYFYAPARAVNPQARSLADYVRAWRQIDGIWHFNAKDNTFYFSVLYPAILAMAGVPEPMALGAVITELYLLEGSKFSTTRNHAVWAHEFLAAQDHELVRLFLSWDRPDRYETNFTHEAYQAFCDYVRPLLAGGAGHPAGGALAAGGALPAALAAGEIERAEHALRPAQFDSALAVRCLIAALAAGAGADSAVLAALAGREPPRPRSSR
jgi:methionyl-tRNA synthetase